MFDFKTFCIFLFSVHSSIALLERKKVEPTVEIHLANAFRANCLATKMQHTFHDKRAKPAGGSLGVSTRLQYATGKVVQQRK